MDLSRVAIAALATSRVVDSTKELLPVIPPPFAKSLFAGVVGIGIAALSPESRDIRTVAVTGLAAAGLAAVVHDVQVAASSFADSNITKVLQQVPRRAKPLGE